MSACVCVCVCVCVDPGPAARAINTTTLLLGKWLDSPMLRSMGPHHIPSSRVGVRRFVTNASGHLCGRRRMFDVMGELCVPRFIIQVFLALIVGFSRLPGDAQYMRIRMEYACVCVCLC